MIVKKPTENDLFTCCLLLQEEKLQLDDSGINTEVKLITFVYIQQDLLMTR